MVSPLYAVLLIGFSFAPGSYGQGEVTGTTDGSNHLQPWLMGLAAVVGFLGMIFVGALVNRIFFSNKTDDDCEPSGDQNIELRTNPNIYENPAMDLAEEGPSSEAKVENENLTNM